MPKLVIVGNGRLDEDYSAVVDAADCVMRFNHCHTFSSNWVGTKTDILALRKGYLSVPGQAKLQFPSEVLDQASEFRVFDCWDIAPVEMPDYAQLYPQMAGKLLFLDTSWLVKARAALRDGECEHKSWKAPTIGFIALLHVLDDPDFVDYDDIVLVGFTWKKIWNGHPQFGEKQLCEQLAKDGKITLVALSS